MVDSHLSHASAGTNPTMVIMEVQRSGTQTWQHFGIVWRTLKSTDAEVILQEILV